VRESFTVHNLPLSERPRERLLKLGSEALSAQEVLALMLGRGTRGESVIVTGQKLISRFGSLRGVAEASVEELQEVKGIGPAKAAQIKAALEFSRRLDGNEGEESRPVLKSPEDVAARVRGQLRGKKKEHFLLLCLDTRNRLIDICPISVGSLDTSVVHPREVFREAISSCASSVIFAHNHPSGDPEPSMEDIELTGRLIKAGEIIGIDVLDHVIVCDSSHLSLKARNLI